MLGEAIFYEDDIFSPPRFDVEIFYNGCMPPIYDDFDVQFYYVNQVSHDSYFVEFAPTIMNEKKIVCVESNKNSMLMYHDKNALCDSYIVEFIYDATENYYERGSYACRCCDNIKFPLYVLKVLKPCLFCLPMLVDSCSNKLFATKIPMHRKWVRLKCASHKLQDASIVFQFFTFYVSIIKIIMPS